MSSDRIRQSVTVLLFIVTVAVNGAANALPLNGQLTAEISDRFRVYVVPAGYVFAIWGLIYVALAAFTIYQALPSRAADPVLRRLGWLPALTGVLNTAWLVLFHYEWFVPSVVVMVALLLTLIAIHLRLWEDRDRLEGVAFWVVRVPFSIYLGWITVATIANVAQTLASLGVDGGGIQPELIASAVLLLGLAVAATFVWRYRDVAYGLVIVWAYIGIVVKEADTPLVPLVAGATAAIVGLLAAWAVIRTRTLGAEGRTAAAP